MYPSGHEFKHFPSNLNLNSYLQLHSPLDCNSLLLSFEHVKHFYDSSQVPHSWGQLKQIEKLSAIES